jgi:TetR/AcrR family transcriptional repressor of nem operon
MARLPIPIRQGIGVTLDQIFSVIAAQFQEKDGKPKRTQAIAMYSMIIGAMQLSRTVANPTLSEEILNSALEVALGMVDARCNKTLA